MKKEFATISKVQSEIIARRLYRPNEIKRYVDAHRKDYECFISDERKNKALSRSPPE